MLWSEVRERFPDQWLIVEALEAHTGSNKQRFLDDLAVIERCEDGSSALKRYREWHQKYPAREFYYLHTRRENLDIRERIWVGIRRGDEIVLKR